MRYAAWSAAAAFVAAVAAASDAAGQSVAARVNAVRDGTVQMRFAPRPGVCGDGNGSTWIQNSRGGRSGTFYGNGRYECVVGPVRVTLDRSAGETVRIRKCVACRARDAAAGDIDLGEIDATEAAKYLIDIARHSSTRVADEALGAAAFADAGDLAPDFERVVRDRDAMVETRKQALFWFGQSDAPTSALVDIYNGLDPRALREQYTFVLSQRRDDDAAITKLIDVARRDPDVQVRKQALFWLGQTHDPRALKFFREVLTP